MSLALIRSNDAIPVDFTAVAEHDAAKLFPLMPDAKITSLAEDIRVNGQRDPIVLVRVADVLVILDGRNRALACRKLGIQPQYVVLDVQDPVKFVLSTNLERRHLDESQRAMVAARLATMRQGARTDLAPIGAKSQEEAAEKLNVSRRNVQRARLILDDGDVLLIAKADAGEMSVNAAAKIVADRADMCPEKALVADKCSEPATDSPLSAKESEVLRLHSQEKMGTQEIADRMGVAQSTISTIKSKLGIASTSLPTKLWADLERAASVLAGVTIQMMTLSEQASGAEVNATEEDIRACIKQLSQAQTAIGKLKTALRSTRSKPRS